MEYRRFELGPPGDSKLPLSNRKKYSFLKNLNTKNFYKLLGFNTGFRVEEFTTNPNFLVRYGFEEESNNEKIQDTRRIGVGKYTDGLAR